MLPVINIHMTSDNNNSWDSALPADLASILLGLYELYMCSQFNIEVNVTI